MARARAKRNRQQAELAEAIIAEWFRMLSMPLGQREMDVGALTASFNEILDSPCEAIADGVDHVKIVVPQPPAADVAGLIDYLERNGDFKQGMSAAVLFGCGR